jgi:hypothetical protein
MHNRFEITKCNTVFADGGTKAPRVYVKYSLYLCVTPLRRMGEWRSRSMHS